MSTDYLVTDGINKNSVPFDLIGSTVDVRMSKSTMEVFHKGIRVASPIRASAMQREPIIKPEHMPEAHRKYLHYNKKDFEA